MKELAPAEVIAEAHLQCYGLRIRSQDAPAVRQLLMEQTALELRAQGSGNTDLMRLCCMQLFSLAQPEDVLLIWQAKQSSFDASCSIEVQLLCGMGLEETIRYLEGCSGALAKEALDWVLECQHAGDFSGFSPVSEMQTHKKYYEG